MASGFNQMVTELDAWTIYLPIPDHQPEVSVQGRHSYVNNPLGLYQEIIRYWALETGGGTTTRTCY
jgi:hypothetical protein